MRVWRRRRDSRRHSSGRHNNSRLLDERVAVRAHALQDALGPAPAARSREVLVPRLVRRDGEWIDQRLRVLPADAEQQRVHRFAHAHVRRVDASDDLWDDEQPRVDVHRVEALEQRRVAPLSG